MKKLDLWLTEWKFARINYLENVRQFMKEVNEKTHAELFPCRLAGNEQSMIWEKQRKKIVDEKLLQLKRISAYESIYVAEQYEIDIEHNDVISYVNFRGELFKNSHMYQPKKGKKYNWILEAAKFAGYSNGDLSLFENERSDQWILDRAEKEMQTRKKQIIQKVKKICGEELVEADGNPFNEFIVKGSNGRKAHVFRILAGGYNIQCLHARILVKERK